MIPESDKQRLDALANDIVNLDQRIISCTIVSNPQGSTISRAVRAEFQQILKPLSEIDGMAGHWAIRAFNAMERLDAIRSKVKYLSVGRESSKTLIFPVKMSDNLMIIMTIRSRTEATEIFDIVTKFVGGGGLILSV